MSAQNEIPTCRDCASVAKQSLQCRDCESALCWYCAARDLQTSRSTTPVKLKAFLFETSAGDGFDYCCALCQERKGVDPGQTLNIVQQLLRQGLVTEEQLAEKMQVSMELYDPEEARRRREMDAGEGRNAADTINSEDGYGTPIEQSPTTQPDPPPKPPEDEENDEQKHRRSPGKGFGGQDWGGGEEGGPPPLDDIVEDEESREAIMEAREELKLTAEREAAAWGRARKADEEAKVEGRTSEQRAEAQRAADEAGRVAQAAEEATRQADRHRRQLEGEKRDKEREEEKKRKARQAHGSPSHTLHSGSERAAALYEDMVSDPEDEEEEEARRFEAATRRYNRSRRRKTEGEGRTSTSKELKAVKAGQGPARPSAAQGGTPTGGVAPVQSAQLAGLSSEAILAQVVQNQLTQQDRLMEMVAAMSLSNQRPADPDPARQGRVPGKLPPLQVPKFSGDILEYQSWRKKFEVLVGEQRYPDTAKLQWLLQSLSGKAEAKVKELGTNEEAYKESLRILDLNYNNVPLIISDTERLIGQLSCVHSETDVAGLEQLIDRLRVHHATLKRNGVSHDRIQSHLGRIFLKLPADTRKTVFIRKGISDVEELGLEELLEFLTQHLKMLRAINPSRGSTASASAGTNSQHRHPQTQRVGRERSSPGPQHTMLNQGQVGRPATKVSPVCAFCTRPGHRSAECKSVVTVDERKFKAREFKLCFNCLSPKHMAKDCQSKSACWHCKKPGHHTAFCFQSAAAQREPRGKPKNVTMAAAVGSVERKETTVLLQPRNEELNSVVMASLRATAINPKNGIEVHNVMIYLDAGASMSCMRVHLARQLRAPILKEESFRASCFGEEKAKSVQAQLVPLTLRSGAGVEMRLELWAVESICSPITLQPIEWTEEEKEFLNRQTTPVLNLPPEKPRKVVVDVLLGMDIWTALLHSGLNNIVKLPNSNLVINHSPLGPILYGNQRDAEDLFHKQLTGPMPKRVRRKQQTILVASTKTNMKNVFGLEGMGIRSEEVKTTAEEEAVRLFQEYFRRLPSGQYEVGFVFKEPNPQLHDNYWTARKRLESLVRSSLKGDPSGKHLRRYDNCLSTWRDEGITEAVDPKAKPVGQVYHLCHMGVYKEEAQSTKIRICLDASQQQRGGNSLNSFLYAGPNLLNNIVEVLLRSRLPKICIICDIRKAFLMLKLTRAHRDFTRMLFVKDVDRVVKEGGMDDATELRVDRFTTVPFGPTSSPFLLNSTLRFHFNLYETETARQLEKDCYVDNLQLSADNTEEALRRYQEAKAILADAGMELRQFVASDAEFNKRIPEEDRGEGPMTKLLGIRWDVKEDVWGLKKPPNTNAVSTKRSLLSCIAQVYDPLQILGPVLLKPKLLLQELWAAELGWDEPMTEEQMKAWEGMKGDVEALKDYNYPRRAIQDPRYPVDIVIFADASKKGIGIAIYLRQEVDGVVSSHLYFAKSAPNPMELTDIPKLELLALWKAGRLAAFVQKTMPEEIVVQSVRLYTDSSIALHQCSTTRQLDVFARNRVADIKKNQEKVGFSIHFVKGEDNPSDLATRGLTYEQLVKSCWLTGPEWLLEPQSNWPRWQPPSASRDGQSGEGGEEEGGVEDDQPTVFALIAQREDTQKEETGPYEMKASRYSTHKRLIHVTGYAGRFEKKLRGQRVPSSIALTGEEVSEAKEKWLQMLQKKCFGEMTEKLKKGKKTQLAKQLDIFSDKKGTLRCGGRLHNAPIPFDAKYPALLPAKHPYTKLIIQDAHVKIGHYRARLTLVKVRDEYWVPNGMTEVAAVLKDCLDCQRYSGSPFAAPSFGPKPAICLEIGACWVYIGCDLCGPFHIKTRPEYQTAATPKNKVRFIIRKCWVLVLTCLTTRGVDFELLPDYSGDSVILGLRRSFAKRGVPKQIWSDNGMNLIYAKEQIRQATEKSEDGYVTPEKLQELHSFLADHEICCYTIAEWSPSSGGAWESMVGQLEKILGRVLWKQLIWEDVMRTLLAEYAVMINSRPIFHVGADVNDGMLLTPLHFFSQATSLAVPFSLQQLQEPEWTPQSGKKPDLMKLSQQVTERLELLWKAFQKMIYQKMSEEHRNQHPTVKGENPRTPEPGEVCLVKEPTPRLTWKNCTIVDLLPTKDGVVRTALVKLKSGKETRRSIKDLIPLNYYARPAPVEEPKVEASQRKVDPNLESEAEESGAEESGPEAESNEEEPPVPRRKPTRTKGPITRAMTQLVTSAYAILDERNEQREREEEEWTKAATEGEEAEEGQEIRLSPRRRRSSSSWSLSILIACLICWLCLTPTVGTRLFKVSMLSPATTTPSPWITRKPSSNHDYQVCLESREGGKILTIPAEPIRCEYPKHRKEQKKVRVQLWIPTAELPTTTAFKCFKEELTVLTYVSFFGGHGIVNGQFAVKTTVGEAECREAVRSKKYGEKMLHEVTPGVWSTNVTLDVQYQWCCFAYQNNVSNFYIIRGKVAPNSDGVLVSDLGVMGGCHVANLTCNQPKFRVIWDEEELRIYCPFELKGKYDATQNKELLLIASLQSALTIRPSDAINRFKKKHCLPEEGMATKEGPIVVITKPGRSDGYQDELNQTQDDFDLRQDVKSARQLIREYDPGNPKAHYLADILEESMEDSFASLFLQFCNIASHQLELNKAVIALDPTIGVRALIGRQDVAAVRHGDVLYLYQCQKVNIVHFYPNHRIEEQEGCFEFTPAALEDGTILFLPPFGRDLVPSSPKIDCADVNPAVRETKEEAEAGRAEWKSLEGRVHTQTLATQQRSLDAKYHRLTFDSPPLFQVKVIWPATANFVYINRIRTLEAQLHATINFTAQLSLHPPSVEAILLRGGRSIFSAIGSVGGEVGSWVTGAAATICKAGANIFNPIIHAVVTTGCIVGGGGLAVYLLFLVGTSKAAKRRCLKVTQRQRGREGERATGRGGGRRLQRLLQTGPSRLRRHREQDSNPRRKTSNEEWEMMNLREPIPTRVRAAQPNAGPTRVLTQRQQDQRRRGRECSARLATE